MKLALGLCFGFILPMIMVASLAYTALEPIVVALKGLAL